MMNLNGLEIILKGLAVGAAMTVPGVSGGTMAMVLGVYDRLLEATGGILKEPGKNLKLLFLFGGGGIVGMVLFSGMISGLLKTGASAPLRCFFLGAVAGGIPYIYRKAEVKNFRLSAIFYPIVGAILAYLLSLLPSGMFGAGEASGLWAFCLQFVGGVILAAALVLPGISASQMLAVMGMYESTLEWIGSLNFLPLLPLGAGTLVGTFLLAKAVAYLLNRYPAPSFLMILGFMLASLPQLLTGISGEIPILLSIVSCAAGFLGLLKLGKLEEAG